MRNENCKIIPGKFSFCNSHFAFSNSPAAQQTRSTPYALNSPYSGLFISPVIGCPIAPPTGLLSSRPFSGGELHFNQQKRPPEAGVGPAGRPQWTYSESSSTLETPHVTTLNNLTFFRTIQSPNGPSYSGGWRSPSHPRPRSLHFFKHLAYPHNSQHCI